MDLVLCVIKVKSDLMGLRFILVLGSDEKSELRTEEVHIDVVLPVGCIRTGDSPVSEICSPVSCNTFKGWFYGREINS